MACDDTAGDLPGLTFALWNRTPTSEWVHAARQWRAASAPKKRSEALMRRQLIWAVLLVLATFGLAQAQETTSGSLTGTVVDAQGAPVPGATVTLTSGQGNKTFQTDTAGKFFAPYLTPGKYNVRVELTGFSPVEQKNIDVRLGQRLDLTGLVLKIGGVEEVVEVVGTAPTVDISSTTTGGVLDTDTLKHLPVGRNFTDSLYLVPGVSDSSGLGRANPSIGGASGLENNYVVDGVNITDTGFGGIGAYNSTFGSLGSGVTTDFVKETQVKTGGFEAEYGEASGGVVNVLTKSGENAFHGSVFGYMRPYGLEADWKSFQAANGIVNTVGRQDSDIGVSLGGPLMKDKLFFFGTFNPQFQNRQFVAPQPSTQADGSVLTFPFAALGPVTQKRKVYSYAGKLTLQATSNHRFDLSLFGDPSKGEAGLQRFSTLRRISYPGATGTTGIEGGYSSIDYGSNNQTLRYDGIMSRNWLIEGSIGHSTNKFDELPTVADQPLFTDTRFVPNGSSGGLGFYENNNGRNYQATLKSTNIFDAAGNHQVRYGVAYEDISFTRDTEYSGVPGALLADGQHLLTGATVQVRSSGGVTFFRGTRGKLAPAGPTTQKYYNGFLQDTWQMGRLTFRPGIRYERQQLTGVDPSLMRFPCHVDDTRPGAADGGGATMPCTFTWKNLWAPRIGATYDIMGNGKAKLYASYGRFYAKIPNDLAARAMSADAGITRQDWLDAAMTQPVANGVSMFGTTTHLAQSAAGPAIIDSKAGSTYSNEILGGVEFEVARNLNVGARYIHRTLPQILEDIGQLPVVGYFLDACGDTTVDYFITNPSPATATVDCGGVIPASFEGPAHKYDAIELTMNKNFSNNWSLLASYRYAKLKGNFEGFYRSDNGQSDPSISSLFDFPTNDPSYTAIGVPEFGFGGDIRYQGTTLGEGVLPNDRPHQVKVYGSYAFGALNLGAGFNWGSGRSLTLLDSNPVYANAGEIPDTLRGGGIQTVDGFLVRTAADTAVDAHADYAIKLNSKQRVILMADAFNLLNRQAALNYDTYRDRGFQVTNSNLGLPLNGGLSSTTGFQAPRAIRVGARFEW